MKASFHIKTLLQATLAIAIVIVVVMKYLELPTSVSDVRSSLQELERGVRAWSC